MLRKKRSGLNLIELSITLAVIGAVVGGIYVAANSVYDNLKRQQAQQQVLQIVQSLRASLKNNRVASDLDTQGAIQLGAVPSDMRTSSGDLKNPWGGGVVIESIDDDAFSITYGGIPATSCADFVVRIFQSPGIASDSGFINATINDDTIDLENITIGALSDACPKEGLETATISIAYKAAL